MSTIDCSQYGFICKSFQTPRKARLLRSAIVLPELHDRMYCAENLWLLLSVVVEIHPIDERIKELCKMAASADDSEVPALFTELKALLAEHSESVRYLAAKTLNRLDNEPSSSKAAD